MKAMLMIAAVLLANLAWAQDATQEVSSVVQVPQLKQSSLPVTTTEQPWQAPHSGAVSEGTTTVTGFFSDPVPGGKVLVIEHLSALIAVNGSADFSLVSVTNTGGNAVDLLPCPRIGQAPLVSSSVSSFSCSTQTKISTPPGERPEFVINLAANASTSGTWNWVVFASGHYENVK
jgi:hypothetical protein